MKGNKIVSKHTPFRCMPALSSMDASAAAAKRPAPGDGSAPQPNPAAVAVPQGVPAVAAGAENSDAEEELDQYGFGDLGGAGKTADDAEGREGLRLRAAAQERERQARDAVPREAVWRPEVALARVWTLEL